MLQGDFLQNFNLNNYMDAEKQGPLRGLNPGPPAPEAGIIPLDQADNPTNGMHIYYK
jgi:hypothetical protein